jgi:hypothetical protein
MCLYFYSVFIPKLIFKYVNLFTICISKGYVYLDYGRNVIIPKLIFKYVNLFTICISKGYVYLDYGRNVKNVMNNASKDIVNRIILIIYI